MNSIRKKIRIIKIKYPLWTLLAFFVCYRVSQVVVSRGWNWIIYRAGLYNRLSLYFSASAKLFLSLLIIVFLMHLLGNMYVFVRKRIFIPAALIPGLYMIIISVLSIVTSLVNAVGFQSQSTIIFSSLYFILVSVSEELVYRGVTADILLRTFLFKCDPYGAGPYGLKERKAIWTATICSGLVFGLAHISNMSHARVSGVLVQMLGAFLMGMVLTAVYYRTGNIYAVIILHTINDIAAAMPVTIIQSDQNISDVISGYGLVDIMMLLPYIAVLMVIMRPSKMEDLWGRWIAEQNEIKTDYRRRNPVD